MSKYQKRGSSSVSKITIVLIVLIILLTLVLGGLIAVQFLGKTGEKPVMNNVPAEQEQDSGFHLPFFGGDQNAEPETTLPEVTEPETEPVPMEPAVTGNGVSSSVLCKSIYTAGAEAAVSVGDKVVASGSGIQLTNRELQIYYLSEVNAYRTSGSETQPNYEWPLENQLCPLGSASQSWQHYFLERAVKSWQAEQAMLYAAQQPQLITEEAYQFLDYLHAEYVPEDRPVHNFIYGDKDCYKPNLLHQEYLDGLTDTIGKLAASQGFGSAEDYIRSVFPAGVTLADVVKAATDYNTAYMYFTEKSFDVAPTDAEIQEYLNANRAQLGTSDEPLISMRHVLLIPEGASVAPDGTVTASAESWDACQKQADDLYATWTSDYVTTWHREGTFGRMANENSADLGSRLDGGFYQDLHKGELPSALDAWCFAADRQVGDVTILRTELGIHMVYLTEKSSTLTRAAKEALIALTEKNIWQSFLRSVPVTVDYSAAAIWTECSEKTFSLVDTLYPDLAHERFPEAITYLQQDYYYHTWGGSTVGQGGCGITTFAMLSTYMTDTLLTPAMMADKYPVYFAGGGTNADIFRYALCDLGYYLDSITTNIDEAIAALQKGQRVISLQVRGDFTSAGHYLLLQRYYEDTGRFQVRDSNIYNYLRLYGHQVDSFTRANIQSGGTNFWIMQPKITRIPACDRCGGTFDNHGPELLLSDSYLCEKCTTALSRRNNFLALLPDLV